MPRQQTPRPFINDPSFSRPTILRELLAAPLPPLPPVMHLELADVEHRQRAATALSRDESALRFRQYNAARRQHHRTDDACWADRAAHLEDFLVRSNLPLVGYMYQRRRLRLALSPEEAFSLGAEGLLRAVRGYDVSRGWAFATFACQCIHNSMMNVSQRSAKRARRLPTQSVTDGNGHETIAAPDAPRDWSDERAALYSALKTNAAGLSTLERLAVQRFLGHDKRTLLDVAKDAGVSKETIRHAQFRAIAKLRGVLCPAE